jgi:RHS repeat-associated protein
MTTAYVGNHFEWTGSTSTMKKYYYAGGQRVAMRTGTTMLNYLLSDHLGSTNVTATSSGGWQGDLLYKPWGETRFTWGTTPTTYRFTGQREQAEIGLYYYGARWYDPYLGRFAQADNIIPGAGNPQAWDRYAGMMNNPLRYTDPSGNDPCDTPYGDDLCSDNSTPVLLEGEVTFEALAGLYGITFNGEGWTSSEMLAVINAAEAVGAAFADNMEGNLTQVEAFRKVYGGINFTKGLKGASTECSAIASGMCTSGANQINFINMAGEGFTGGMAFLRNRNNVVHELGHAFSWAKGGDPYDVLGTDIGTDSNLERGTEPDYNYGFAIGYNHLTWQMSTVNASSPNEIFADQFLAWTFDRWYSGTDEANMSMANARRNWMDTNMPNWLN